MFLLVALSALSVVQQADARPVAYHFRRANATSAIGNFGSCTVPQVKFAVGFDNRKETSFEPVDQVSYNHGSADNIDIITQFMCDTLVNTCAADATAKATCATAKTAADGATAKTGAQADAFNAAFNIVTNFAAVAEISDQGSTVAAGAAATGAAAATSTGAAASTTAAATAAAVSASATEPCDLTVTVTSTPNAALAATTTEACAASTVTSTVTVTVTAGGAAATTAAGAASAAKVTSAAGTGTASAAAATGTAAAAGNASTAGADFGTCTTPQIEFAAGLGGRKETAFEPTDLTAFNHGSADNIAVITSFICGQVGSSCKGNAAATALCTTATAAAAAAAAGTGAQADAFNAAFGVTTNFAAVAQISNTGVTVAAGSSGAAATTKAAAAAATTVASSVASSAVSSTAAAAATAAAAGANLQTFTGALGGVAAPTVTAAGNGQFQVTGNDTFNNVQSAIERSCDVQNNKCSNAANSSGNANGLTVAACGAQETTCNAA